MGLVIERQGFRLRPLSPGDRANLVRHGDNRSVWINLTDRFPHPYTLADADAWIASQQALAGAVRHFAIEVDGGCVGGVGCEPGDDLCRRTAEVGYWLGEEYWGRGLATEALLALTEYAFGAFDVVRLEAHVLAWNPASCRVLEKAGYQLDARLCKKFFKDDRIADAILYSRLR